MPHRIDTFLGFFVNLCKASSYETKLSRAAAPSVLAYCLFGVFFGPHRVRQCWCHDSFVCLSSDLFVCSNDMSHEWVCSDLYAATTWVTNESYKNKKKRRWSSRIVLLLIFVSVICHFCGKWPIKIRDPTKKKSCCRIRLSHDTRIVSYRVAKTHRIPYLYRSFPAKVTYN